MPLFSSKKHTKPASAPIATPGLAHSTSRTSNFFSSHRRSASTSPTSTTTPHTTHTMPATTSNSMHTPHSSLSLGSKHGHNHGTKNGAGLFSHHEDPSIAAARQRVSAAEAAERDADRALIQARAAVRDARAQVAALEREAAEEARMAKIKQGQARDLGKRGSALGRHDRI